MKVWLVVLMFFLPLAFSAGAVEEAVDHFYDVEAAVEADTSTTEPIGANVDVATWLAMLVGWTGLLILEVRMNDGMKQLHQKIDKLERYVNTRDNLLAIRIDELDEASLEDADDARERPRDDRRDDSKPHRRH